MVWDCPPSKGWQNHRGERGVVGGFSTRPDWQDPTVTGQSNAIVWDCPPSEGWQNGIERIVTRACHFGVWDCPPSKGWQESQHLFQLRREANRFGILPPVRGMAESTVTRTARFRLLQRGFGIAPRPRDGRMLARMSRPVCEYSRLGLPPVRGMAECTAPWQRRIMVWDCPPSEGWQNEFAHGTVHSCLGLPPVRGMAEFCAKPMQSNGMFGIAPPSEGWQNRSAVQWI